jgi:hypothetical protein
MFKREKALKIALVVLGIIAFMDLLRGYMHTFNIWYASENIAHMTQTADTMMLMNTFGITNFLTVFVYILIIVKAKELAPYVLTILPLSYLIGIISIKITGISQIQTAEWNGQYMMYVYLTLSFMVGLNYFVASMREKNLKRRI